MNSVYYLLILVNGRRGLAYKGVGLVMKYKVRIPKKSLVVLGSASNLKMLLCYVRKPYSVASIVGYPSVTPNEKKPYRLLTWEKRGSINNQ